MEKLCLCTSNDIEHLGFIKGHEYICTIDGGGNYTVRNMEDRCVAFWYGQYRNNFSQYD